MHDNILTVKVIADANIFLAVALEEPEKESIINSTKNVELASPKILSFELSNALSRLKRRNLISTEETLRSWHIIQYIPVELLSIDCGKTLKLALDMNIYAYDAYYLTCAISNELPLLTLDKGMINKAKTLGIKLLEVE